MKFAELAEYFEKLEATTKRLELTDILSQLFKKATNDEIGKICYLIQGRVAPFFEPTEIGMSENLVAIALGRAFDTTKEEVIRSYRKLGNMGLAASKFASNSKLKTPASPAGRQNSKLSVSDVFEQLHRIAKTGGEGSVDKKLTILSDLFKSLDPVSVKHVANIPIGTLRLGIGDPTVLDALSIAKKGDKTLRPLLEDAYNKTSDLGFVAETFYKKGQKGIEQIKLIVGKPVRPALAERMPNAEEAVKRLGNKFGAEPKFDGFRCITGFVPLYVRGKGFISAKDIKKGDYVLTHRGQFKRIIATQKRTIDKKERLFKLQSYLGNEIKVTEGHPILVLRSNKQMWVNVEDIQKEDYLSFPTPNISGLGKAPNPHLKLTTSSGYSKTILADDSFYKFIGFWIGDGFTNEFHNTQRIGLTFNEKRERELADEYKKIVNKNLLISRISEYLHNGGLNIYWRDEPFKDWLHQYFRRDWKGKMIPEWFTNLSKENFLAFLRGWIESDGTPRHSGGYKIVTKESDLASLAQLIGLKLGVILGLRRVRVKDSTYYEIIVPGTNKNAVIYNNTLKVKILHLDEIKNRDPRTVLYNFQVEDDESYCTSLIALHNCQIHKNEDKVEIFSRNLENMTHAFPDIARAVKKEVKAKSFILEGEAIAYNPVTSEFLPFQETSKRRRKHEVEEMAKKLPLVVFAFDILYLNGEDITQLPYSERRRHLEKIIHSENLVIRKAEERVLSSAPEILEFFNEAVSEGLEGLMLKKLDASYKAGGRGFHWIKFKRSQSGELADTVDCVLLGVYRGKGKRTDFGVGGLLVGVYDEKKDEFVTISRVGTGLTDEEFRTVNTMAEKSRVSHKPARVNSKIEPSFWVEPKEVLEIYADEITKSPIHTAGERDGIGYALRFPRLVKFRGKDKRAEDATTVSEIRKLYDQQYKRK